MSETRSQEILWNSQAEDASEIRKRDNRILELESQVESLRAERDELNASFELRWKADMRAIARWREAHPGNELVMPDHADLCVWLLAERDALQADGERLDWEDANPGKVKYDHFSRSWYFASGNFIHFPYKNKREAIDAALLAWEENK